MRRWQTAQLLRVQAENRFFEQTDDRQTAGKEKSCSIAFASSAKESAKERIKPALGVSVKSVQLVAGKLGFYSQSGHTKDFKNSIRSFRARRLAQAEVRRVLCMCCSSCYVP